MINSKSVLAIIPARGGSKRLPHKNILDFAGKPLITWTIMSAKNSRYIDNIIVSSDKNKILALAKSMGVDVVKRPEELSRDETTSFDVVKHAIDNIKRHDYIILLQPTSPLRTSQHIDESIGFLVEKEADAVISVCEVEHSPLWMNVLGDDCSMNHFLSQDIKNKRSQDLRQYFRLNGAIYISNIDALLKEGGFFIRDKIYAYIMKSADSIDIDNIVDFKVAEQMYFLSRSDNKDD